MTEIKVYKDGDDLATHAADFIIRAAQEAITQRGRFVIALAGGSTPEKTYALLAQPDRAAQIDWTAFYVFLGDERFVPPGDKNSNFGMAWRALLDHVPIPEANIYAVPTQTETLTQCVADYADTLRQFFHTEQPPVFDLILLGLGDDGHTASLFPGMPSLDETQEWIVGSPPGTLPPPVDRITLTFPVLNAARQVVFFVSGEKKAERVQEIVENSPDVHKRPAVGVQPTQGTLTWMVDAAAAKLLRSSGRE